MNIYGLKNRGLKPYNEYQHLSILSFFQINSFSFMSHPKFQFIHLYAMEVEVVVLLVMPYKGWMIACGLSQQLEIASFKVQRNSLSGEAQFNPLNYQPKLGQKNVWFHMSNFWGLCDSNPINLWYIQTYKWRV